MSNLHLLGDVERIFYLDPQGTDSTFQLGVSRSATVANPDLHCLLLIGADDGVSGLTMRSEGNVVATASSAAVSSWHHPLRRLDARPSCAKECHGRHMGRAKRLQILQAKTSWFPPLGLAWSTSNTGLRLHLVF
ncbi:MAG: hypothetical protein ACP5QB_12445 [Thiomonas sp.]